MAYIAPRSLEESGRVDEDILGKMSSWKGMGCWCCQPTAHCNKSRDPIDCWQWRIQGDTSRPWHRITMRKSKSPLLFLNSCMESASFIMKINRKRCESTYLKSISNENSEYNVKKILACHARSIRVSGLFWHAPLLNLAYVTHCLLETLGVRRKDRPHLTASN